MRRLITLGVVCAGLGLPSVMHSAYAQSNSIMALPFGASKSAADQPLSVNITFPKRNYVFTSPSHTVTGKSNKSLVQVSITLQGEPGGFLARIDSTGKSFTYSNVSSLLPGPALITIDSYSADGQHALENVSVNFSF